MQPIRALFLAVPLLTTLGAAPAGAQEKLVAVERAPAFDHARWTDILVQYVQGDTFDYKSLAKEAWKLDRYLSTLTAVKADDFAKWSRKERYAFWINVYNAWTVKRVLDGYPVASIRDLGDEKVSVWDRDLVPLGALAPDLQKEKLSLNDIENKILRPVFKDARVHAAINCASEGCPPIQAAAFTAEKLDEELDRAVKAWLADPKRNRFDAAKNTATVSQVFEWFADDFVRDAKSVQAWIAKYAPADQAWVAKAEKLEIKYLDYSWKLNEKR